MTIFITSDHHFHHKNILEFEPRPFESPEQMGEALITAWNRVVKKNDTVYYLGDLSFGDVHQWREVLNELRGNIILIKGNHDKSKIINTMHSEGLLAAVHPLGTVLKAEKFIMNLSHYPMLIGARPRNFSIHGHLHSHDTGYTNHVNVGIDSAFAKSFDAPFGTPISMDDLTEHLKKINPLVEEERARIAEEEGRGK